MGSTTSTISPFFAAKTLNASEMRYALEAAFNPSPSSVMAAETGVIAGGGNTNTAFVPTSVGTGGAPAISVAPGQCVIQRPTGGTYVCTLPTASSNILIDTPLPSSGQTRIDVLCASVVDGEADGGTPPQTNTLTLTTVKGTAGASPTPPATPAGSLALYRVTVNNAGALTFTDVRTYTRATGGIRPVAAGDVRAGSSPGDLRIFSTGQIDAWINPTGSWAWVTIVAPSVWTQVNVPWTSPGGACSFGSGSGPGGPAAAYCRYKRAGNDLSISYNSIFGSSGISMGTGSITTVLPNGWVTPTGRDQWIPAHLWVNDSVSGLVADFAGLALITGGSNTVWPFFLIQAQNTNIGQWKVADTLGVPGHSIPLIIAGFAQGGSIQIGPATIEIAS